MNRKNIPLILMLAAGAVTCVISFVGGYSILGKLLSLFIVLVLFFFLGSILKWTLDYFDSQNEKKKKEMEAVIEKEAENKTQSDEGESQK